MIAIAVGLVGFLRRPLLSVRGWVISPAGLPRRDQCSGGRSPSCCNSFLGLINALRRLTKVAVLGMALIVYTHVLVDDCVAGNGVGLQHELVVRQEESTGVHIVVDEA